MKKLKLFELYFKEQEEMRDIELDDEDDIMLNKNSKVAPPSAHAVVGENDDNELNEIVNVLINKIV